MKKLMIVAHRGASAMAPENTLAAFRQAVELGTDTVEFDVFATSDNHLIVHHDYYLERTTNGKGSIETYTLAQLKKFDAGSWFSPEFRGENIPTLEEVLDFGKGKCRFEIELKSTSERFLNNVINTIEKFNLKNEVEFTSSHQPLLARLKQLIPNFMVGVFFSPRPDWMEPVVWNKQTVDYLTLLNAKVAHIPQSSVDSTIVKMLHKSGYRIHAADCDFRNEMKRMIKLGVDQFSTREVELAIRVREKWERGSYEK